MEAGRVPTTGDRLHASTPMADPETIEVYERSAAAWTAARSAEDQDHVAWVEGNRRPGPLLDIGCGPGWHLTDAAPPTVALDPASAMLDLVGHHASAAARIRAVAEALPLAAGSIGGALANRVYLHLPSAEVPLALADLHRVLADGGPAFVCMMGDERGQQFRAGGQFPGRLFSAWEQRRLHEVLHRAGFSVDEFTVRESADVERAGRPRRFEIRLRRAVTLADTVGPEMGVLICGLNPSVYSAEAGVAFARPGNRFWPAALAAGMVSRDRDPRHALLAHGIGMTDLVKRPTRRADQLSPNEYRTGVEELERQVRWLRPKVVCFVGLAGWRAAVDRTAVAGVQRAGFGGTTAYLMPSTSGINASSSLADLTAHLRQALQLAGGGPTARPG